MNTKHVTLGGDPEFFLERRDAQAGRWVVTPACGLLGGTKGAPRTLRHGGGVQEDNVMAELTFNPATSAQSCLANFTLAMHDLNVLLETELEGQWRVARGDTKRFSPDQLATPQARQFGCSPDFDGYSMGRPNPVINPDTIGRFRYAGGHIHIGIPGMNAPAFVAAMFADLFIGTHTAQSDWGERKETYGTPGRYRPTAYGIEYRTPGNGFWYEGYKNYAEGTHPHDATCILQAAKDLGCFMQLPAKVIKDALTSVPWVVVRDYMMHDEPEDDEDQGVVNEYYDMICEARQPLVTMARGG